MNWFRRRQQPVRAPVDPLDLELVLRQGLQDAPSARNAIARLDRERRDLERQRTSIDDQFNRMTPRQLKTAARARVEYPQLETNLLVDAMQGLDAERETQRAEQLAEIDNRLHAIERIRRELNAFLKRAGQAH